MTFIQKLGEAIQKADSCLCVGLDPNINRIPESIKEEHATPAEQVYNFLTEIIDQTANYCAAYKPNLGFFEALGPQGLHVFQQVIDYIPEAKIIIADAKRGDISSTADHYAQAYFEQFNVDAITISPLMGFETLEPFLTYPGKGLYVLTLTSNPGANDFLKQPFAEYDSMAQYIAENLAARDKKFAAHIGMVVGATQPADISPVIYSHPESSLLIPGIGTQGGSIEELISALQNHQGIPLINSSRSIIYAGQHANNWQKAVSDKAREYKTLLKPITEQYV